MPEDYEQLQRKIEEGLQAIRELKRLKAEEQRRNRPRLRLIKGSVVGAALAAGVEWCWNYKVAVAVAAAAVTFAGGVIAEQPHSPGADPPAAVKPPASVKPTAPPRPKVTPTPRRTSPPRTQVPMRVEPPAEQATIKPAAKPKEKPKVTPTASRTTTQPTASTPIVSLPVTPTLEAPVTPASCTINLLGVKLCLPLG